MVHVEVGEWKRGHQPAPPLPPSPIASLVSADQQPTAPAQLINVRPLPPLHALSLTRNCSSRCSSARNWTWRPTDTETPHAHRS